MKAIYENIVTCTAYLKDICEVLTGLYHIICDLNLMLFISNTTEVIF